MSALRSDEAVAPLCAKENCARVAVKDEWCAPHYRKPLIEDDPRHGTRHAYGHYGCRCGPCVEVNAAWRRQNRQARPILRECRQCGKEFNARRAGKGGNNRWLCSDACRLIVKREAQKKDRDRRLVRDPEAVRAYRQAYYRENPEKWERQREKRVLNPERATAQQKLSYRRNLLKKRKQKRDAYAKRDTPTVHERAMESGFVDTDKLEFCRCDRQCGRPTNAAHLAILHLSGLGLSDTEIANKVGWISRQEARRYRVEAEAGDWPKYRRGHTPKVRIVRLNGQNSSALISVQDRFWLKVDKRADGHWMWTAAVNRAGEGVFHHPAVATNSVAERYAWGLLRGELQPQQTLRNDCGRPGCVNPDHWHILTAEELAERAAERSLLWNMRSLDAPLRGKDGGSHSTLGDKLGNMWADPTGDAAVEATELTRANITSIAAFLQIAKQAPIIPDDAFRRFLNDECRLIVTEDGVRFVKPKAGWDDAGLWRSEAVLPVTAHTSGFITRGGMARRGKSRGHKGHAKASWKGHVSHSAKGRKTKARV